MTQCRGKLELGAIGKRKISVDFNGGAIASDGGILLLREASENRIKDLKLDCSGDRLSCHRFITNFFRLILHTAAYALMHELRKACKSTKFGTARIETLRLRLLKIGVRIRQTTRRIWFHLSESTPEKELWTEIMRKLVAA